MDCSSSRSRHKLDSSVTEGVTITVLDGSMENTEMEPGGSLVLQLLLTDSMSEELMMHESGFLVSHSLLYTFSMLSKSLASSAVLEVSCYCSTT